MARQGQWIWFDCFGFPQSFTALRKLRHLLLTLGSSLKAGLGFVRKAYGKQFQRQGAYWGPRWAPLQPSTVKARKNKWGYYSQSSSQGPTAKRLQWTGYFRRSVIIRRDPYHREIIGPNAVLMMSRHKKGRLSRPHVDHVSDGGVYEAARPVRAQEYPPYVSAAVWAGYVGTVQGIVIARARRVLGRYFFIGPSMPLDVAAGPD